MLRVEHAWCQEGLTVPVDLIVLRLGKTQPAGGTQTSNAFSKQLLSRAQETQIIWNAAMPAATAGMPLSQAVADTFLS